MQLRPFLAYNYVIFKKIKVGYSTREEVELEIMRRMARAGENVTSRPVVAPAQSWTPGSC